MLDAVDCNLNDFTKLFHQTVRAFVSGEEGECRPLLLCADPLGHRAPATLFIARFMRNDISGYHYEMVSKVAFGVSRSGGGCTGCMGVDTACLLRWVKERGVFWSQPPPTPSRG